MPRLPLFMWCVRVCACTLPCARVGVRAAVGSLNFSFPFSTDILAVVDIPCELKLASGECTAASCFLRELKDFLRPKLTEV